jgi:WD40 repeat protein
MGCSTRLLSAGVYWSPRCCYLAGSQSRRSVFGNFRLVHTILLSLSCPKRLPGEDLAINLWDIGSGKRVKNMTGHTSLVYSLAFSAESSLLVSGGADWTIRCWDVNGAGGLRVKSQKNGNTLNGSRHGDDESIET